MLKQKSSRAKMAVLLVAAVMMVAASTAIASNMAFKINKSAVATSLADPNQGSSWTSIPFFNPYTSFENFCQQTGLPSTGAIGNRAQLADFCATTFNSPSTGICSGGSFRTHVCGAVDSLGPQPLVPGYGVRIRPPSTFATGSIIIVGSHNPSLPITVPPISGAVGSYWFSVPYHTTAVNFQDMCNQAGMISSGSLGLRGQIVRLKAEPPSPGFQPVFTCGTATTQTFVLGEAVRLRQSSGFSFIPAHF